MDEQLINFETAKLAKEKGYFNGGLRTHYDNDGKLLYISNNDKWGEINISAPTQSSLQKSLREKHKIHIEIGCNGDEYYVNSISYPEEDEYVYDQDLDTIGFKTYEEALELGLQAALKLIEYAEE